MAKMSRIIVMATIVLLVAATPVLAAHEVPIKGTVMGEHEVAFFHPDCEPAEPGFEVFWRFSTSGYGTMSHLGKVHYDLVQCTAIYPGAPPASSGTTVFTAANGDTLNVTQTMLSEIIEDGVDPDPDGFIGGGNWSITGGTGRFHQASGGGDLSIIGDVPGGDALFGLPDGLAEISFHGGIMYDASHRSAK